MLDAILEFLHRLPAWKWCAVIFLVLVGVELWLHARKKRREAEKRARAALEERAAAESRAR